MVDLGTDGAVADLGVDFVSEIERRGAERHLARLALGREDDDLGGIERQLEVFEKIQRIFRRAVQRVAYLLEPLVEFILVLRNRGLLVFPVCGETPLGDLLHAPGADLHLDPHAVGSHDRGVQRLVTVGLGHRNPVAQPVGLRGVDIGNRGVDLPALRFLGGERQRIEYDADGEKIVDLLEGNLLALHLHPYRIDALHAARNLVVDAVAVERRNDRRRELLDQLAARGLRFLQLPRDLGILLRKAVLHAEVLQLALDGEQPQAIGQRREEVDRLAGDLDLLVHRH